MAPDRPFLGSIVDQPGQPAPRLAVVTPARVTSRAFSDRRPLGSAAGGLSGPVQAASRSYPSRAAPERLRVPIFGLCALSAKTKAFMGPLLVGWLTAMADSQWVGMSVIIGHPVLGFRLMSNVPEAKEQRTATR